MAFPVEPPTPQRPAVDLVSGARLVARARPWTPDPQVALLTILDPRPVALAVDVPTWLARLADEGYRRVHTSAISPAAATVFERYGFAVVQELVVLGLGPVALSRWADHRAERPWRVRTLRWRTDALRPRREVKRALEIDREAFGDRWCLDLHGWRDAVHATSDRRVTVVEHDNDLAGFAITGTQSDDAFLQRLAVAPHLHRRGVARALVDDAIGWVARGRRRQVFVNTAHDNTAALGLYQSMGFQRRPEGLVVLEGTTQGGSEVGR